MDIMRRCPIVTNVTYNSLLYNLPENFIEDNYLPPYDRIGVIEYQLADNGEVLLYPFEYGERIDSRNFCAEFTNYLRDRINERNSSLRYDEQGLYFFGDIV
jgi:hypothetical protein